MLASSRHYRLGLLDDLPVRCLKNVSLWNDYFEFLLTGICVRVKKTNTETINTKGKQSSYKLNKFLSDSVSCRPRM